MLKQIQDIIIIDGKRTVIRQRWLKEFEALNKMGSNSTKTILAIKSWNMIKTRVLSVTIGSEKVHLESINYIKEESR